MPRIMITPFEKKSSDSRIQDQYAGWRYTNSRYSMAEIDDYILDVLLRDLVGHDRRPVSFLVFLWLFFEQQRSGDSVQISYVDLAENVGISRCAPAGSGRPRPQTREFPSLSLAVFRTATIRRFRSNQLRRSRGERGHF